MLVMSVSHPFTLSHWYSFSPHCSLLISSGTDKNNLFDNQELPKLVIISFFS